jgi:SpoU rRNA methylase family enzyme
MNMITDVLQMKTDQALLKKLGAVSTHKLTPQEMLEQRVSFVYGSLKPESSMTRERVRQMLLERGV